MVLSSNGVAGQYPSQRTERSLRTGGFPALAVTDSGAEMTIAHASFAFFRMVQIGDLWKDQVLPTGFTNRCIFFFIYGRFLGQSKPVQEILCMRSGTGSGISSLLKWAKRSYLFFLVQMMEGQTWPICWSNHTWNWFFILFGFLVEAVFYYWCIRSNCLRLHMEIIKQTSDFLNLPMVVIPGLKLSSKHFDSFFLVWIPVIPIGPEIRVVTLWLLQAVMSMFDW